jgi:thiosulfate sulfurtransferase
MIDEKDVTVVDIRRLDVFDEAHIPQAVLINDDNVEEFLKNADKTKPLICYCYHGHSSQMAAGYFAEQGFQEVYSMVGGFESWRQHYESVSGGNI